MDILERCKTTYVESLGGLMAFTTVQPLASERVDGAALSKGRSSDGVLNRLRRGMLLHGRLKRMLNGGRLLEGLLCQRLLLKRLVLEMGLQLLMLLGRRGLLKLLRGSSGGSSSSRVRMVCLRSHSGARCSVRHSWYFALAGG
jgi:hypothetical protein